MMSNICLEKVCESITCLLMVYMLNGTSSQCNIKVEESKVIGKTHFCDVYPQKVSRAYFDEL